MFSFLKKKIPLAVETKRKIQDGGRLEINSPTWAFIKGWVENDLEQMRMKNDNGNMDSKQTAILRGRIKYAKALLALPKDKKRGILNK